MQSYSGNFYRKLGMPILSGICSYLLVKGVEIFDKVVAVLQVERRNVYIL